MPTENRSSNTEMVSLSRDLIDLTLAHLPNDSAAKWEIHEVLARPAPQPHPEPIAWMVGTAIWWTKEEAERDAAETGKTITPIGPMSGIAPAEEHQGDPVAWRGINELGEVVTDWVDGVPPASMVDLCGNPASFAKIERAYTHADPDEVERLRDELDIVKNNDLKWQGLREQEAEIENLRAQLAERDALLRELEGKTILSWPDKRRISATLSASAEPIAPAAQPGKCLDGGDCGLGGTCKWCPHTSPSPARQPS